MTFEEALELLKEGNRVISKNDKERYDQSGLALDEDGNIVFMNEPWNPTPAWLLEYMKDEWINVEEDCSYHDHDVNGDCVNE